MVLIDISERKSFSTGQGLFQRSISESSMSGLSRDKFFHSSLSSTSSIDGWKVSLPQSSTYSPLSCSGMLTGRIIQSSLPSIDRHLMLPVCQLMSRFAFCSQMKPKMTFCFPSPVT